jgi:hypothetical protein
VPFVLWEDICLPDSAVPATALRRLGAADRCEYCQTAGAFAEALIFKLTGVGERAR